MATKGKYLLSRMNLKAEGGNNYFSCTGGRPVREVEHTEGSTLSFNSIMADQHIDIHCYMIPDLTANIENAYKPLYFNN
jgi:hypothetical protein